MTQNSFTTEEWLKFTTPDESQFATGKLSQLRGTWPQATD